MTESIIKRAVFVTDQGSNLIKALRRETRLSCCAHILNNIMENVLDKEEKTGDGKKVPVYKTIAENFSACKALVTYFKQSCLNAVSTFQKLLSNSSF